jgi:hypothetical protein
MSKDSVPDLSLVEQEFSEFDRENSTVYMVKEMKWNVVDIDFSLKHWPTYLRSTPPSNLTSAMVKALACDLMFPTFYWNLINIFDRGIKYIVFYAKLDHSISFFHFRILSHKRTARFYVSILLMFASIIINYYNYISWIRVLWRLFDNFFFFQQNLFFILTST